MFALIIEFFLEFLVEICGELFMELLIHSGSRIPWVSKAATGLLLALIFFLSGAIIGVISLLFFPEAFVRSESLHGISLVVTPVLAGTTMAAIGWVRRQKRKRVVPLESFSYGFVLAFGVALIRFYFTV